MRAILEKLISSQSLSLDEAIYAIHKIGVGDVNPSQIAGFLLLIQQKGITPEELAGFQSAMIELSIGPDFSLFDAMDVCGTGGDGKHTFNISTTASFVVAGAGQKVAKHGNTGVSSPVGSSNVLEFMGVKFTNDADYLLKKLETANICYLHAPLFHPAMRFVGNIRKELGIKTFFNILGPLINPTKVKIQLTGVPDLITFGLYQEVFAKSGHKFGVVHSLDIYDEVSLTSDFKFADQHHAKIYTPQEIGFEKIAPEALYVGDTLQDSADIILNILQNKGTKAQTDTVIINAALALVVAKNVSISDGIMMARESLESGKAYGCFLKLVE